MARLLKKSVAIAMVCTLSSASAIALHKKNAQDADAFVALAYVAAENGASTKA